MNPKVITYHCPWCGGATDPCEKVCKYCLSEIVKRENRKRDIRVLINCGQDYVYFDDITSVSMMQDYDDTSVYDIYGEIYRLRRPAEETYHVDMIITDRSRMLYEKIRNGKIYDLRFEFLRQDRAIETKGYSSLHMNFTPSLSDDMAFTADLEFHTAGDTKLFNTVVPIGITCPNCGAKITSKYGACDYCGGWIEWAKRI